MQAANNFGREFLPNRSKRNLRMLYVICWGCIVIGLCVSVGGIVSTEEWYNPDDMVGAGASLLGIGALFLLIGHFLTTPFNVHYFVGKDGITLQAFRTTLRVPYAEIESFTILAEDQSEKMVLLLQNKMADRQKDILGAAFGEGKEGNIWEQAKKAFHEQKKTHYIYKFLSVALAFSSSGRQRGPRRAQRADLPCPTVFILLKSGEGFLISPLDTEGFVNETKKYPS